MLRCTGGQVWLSQPNDAITLHLAWFEWDGTDTGSVLEAFRHLPEACMGSIGMTLVSKEKPILYTVRGQETEVRDQEEAEIRDQESSGARWTGAIRDVPRRGTAGGRDQTGDRDQEESSSSTDHRSLITDHSLSFDHTIFTDPAQAGGSALFRPQLVHSFRAVWVAGLDNADARAGLGGESFANLRSIRLTSALHRYRPEHARVIQGAVRGAPTAEAAWQAFEAAMLVDLKMENEIGHRR